MPFMGIESITRNGIKSKYLSFQIKTKLTINNNNVHKTGQDKRDKILAFFPLNCSKLV